MYNLILYNYSRYNCDLPQERVAIKTIDLKDVMDVLADDSQGKQNCFK